MLFVNGTECDATTRAFSRGCFECNGTVVNVYNRKGDVFDHFGSAFDNIKFRLFCPFLTSGGRLDGWSRYLICERQRALYGIKCVLRIFWQTWLHILTNKKKSTFYKHVPCNTLTHSTNEDLLNIKRKGDPEVSYPLSYVRYHWNPEPVCNKSHFVSLFYLYLYF